MHVFGGWSWLVLVSSSPFSLLSPLIMQPFPPFGPFCGKSSTWLDRKREKKGLEESFCIPGWQRKKTGVGAGGRWPLYTARGRKKFLYFSSWRVEGIVSCSGETRGVGDEKVEQF